MKEANNILQEESYYPFGLQHSGTKAAQTGTENQYQYNGIEFASDNNLNVYTAFYRTLDPAIARWWQVDPKAEDEKLIYKTPYNSMSNNPILRVDKDGDNDYYTYQDGYQIMAINVNNNTADNFYRIDNQGNVSFMRSRNLNNEGFDRLTDVQKVYVVTNEYNQNAPVENGQPSYKALSEVTNANGLTEAQQTNIPQTNMNQNATINTATQNGVQIIQSSTVTGNAPLGTYSVPNPNSLGNIPKLLTVRTNDPVTNSNANANLQVGAGVLPTPAAGATPVPLPAGALPANQTRTIPGPSDTTRTIPLTDANGNFVTQP